MFVVADVRVKSPVSQRFRGRCGVVILELGFNGGSPADRLRLVTDGGFEMGAGGGVSDMCAVLGCSVDTEEYDEVSLSVKLETEP